MCVPKRDGSMRLCIDYREVNKLTVRDNIVAPSFGVIPSRVSNFSGNVVLTTLVLALVFINWYLGKKIA